MPKPKPCAKVMDEFPGHYELKLEVFREGTRPDNPVLAEESTDGLGYSYEDMRALLGGDQGYVTDSKGKTHHVSLLPWSSDQPETLRFLLNYKFIPDKSRWDEFQRRARESVERQSDADT
jgi:hypothetical protein